jgi:hypothetical protein
MILVPVEQAIKRLLNTYRYAAYGSNLHPDRLRKRVSSAVLRGTCFLPAFDLRFHKVGRTDGSGKCDIVPGSGGVFVAVFDIAVSERSILDDIEGLGAGYNHKRIRAGEHGVCWTYIADPGAVDHSLRPLDWYKEYVIRGAHFHGFPDDYLSYLQSVSADVDTHKPRAEREWKVVETLEFES